MCPGCQLCFFIVEAGRDRILGKCLQSERGDELGRVLRHHDKDIVTLLDEQAGQLGRFVGRDRAGHAEDDVLLFLSSSLGQNHPAAQITLRAHDVTKLEQIFFHRTADDGVAIIAPMLHFARGGLQPQFDLRGRFRSSFR